MTQAPRNLLCQDLPTSPRPELGKILVTGASGYVGGRLVPELLARGYSVRAMVRAESTEYCGRWPDAEVVVADVLSARGLQEALTGVHTAYYLIHSLMLESDEFELADIRAAINFRDAAAAGGVRRIIYLGGLGDISGTLSPHLRNRIHVAEELERGAVPVTILRAAVIIGSGSASFEILANLVRNLPFFLIPPWARTRCQPISIRDVVKYLVGVLEADEAAGQSYDIGGPEILTYEAMLKTLAELLGKRRVFITSPISGIPLFAYITNLATPVPEPIVHRLLEGSVNDVLCLHDKIRLLLPFANVPFREALVRALSREEQDVIATRWSDAYPPAHELAIKLHEVQPQPQYTASCALTTAKPAAALFKALCSIGGREGWFHANWLWWLRGWIDRLLMGVGTSRGRRSRATLRVGDVIDFWRVEELKANELLRLRAEMKLPGRAWLEFRIAPQAVGNQLTVQAFFQIGSLLGKAYWYACLPFHWFIFDKLIQHIERRS